MVLWHCGTGALWRCGVVTLWWHCGIVGCGVVALWHSGAVAPWHSGTMAGFLFACKKKKRNLSLDVNRLPLPLKDKKLGRRNFLSLFQQRGRKLFSFTE